MCRTANKHRKETRSRQERIEDLLAGTLRSYRQLHVLLHLLSNADLLISSIYSFLFLHLFSLSSSTSSLPFLLLFFSSTIDTRR